MTNFAVLVIPARCQHIVDVQLTGDSDLNRMLVEQAQRTDCTPCLRGEIAANTARLREKHPEAFQGQVKGFRDRKFNGVR